MVFQQHMSTPIKPTHGTIYSPKQFQFPGYHPGQSINEFCLKENSKLVPKTTYRSPLKNVVNLIQSFQQRGHHYKRTGLKHVPVGLNGYWKSSNGFQSMQGGSSDLRYKPRPPGKIKTPRKVEKGGFRRFKSKTTPPKLQGNGAATKSGRNQGFAMRKYRDKPLVTEEMLSMELERIKVLADTKETLISAHQEMIEQLQSQIGQQEEVIALQCEHIHSQDHEISNLKVQKVKYSSQHTLSLEVPIRLNQSF